MSSDAITSCQTAIVWRLAPAARFRPSEVACAVPGAGLPPRTRLVLTRPEVCALAGSVRRSPTANIAGANGLS